MKEAEAARPPVRRTAGLLLQAAGKGLLNLNRREREEDELFKPPSSCISFGLYGGHLPVDEEGGAATNLHLDDRPYIAMMDHQKPTDSAKKIFSNWGGEFFKKNLDFRANTNKILEKMQLNKTGQEHGTIGSTTAQNGSEL